MGTAKRDDDPAINAGGRSDGTQIGEMTKDGAATVSKKATIEIDERDTKDLENKNRF